MNDNELDLDQSAKSYADKITKNQTYQKYLIAAYKEGFYKKGPYVFYLNEDQKNKFEQWRSTLDKRYFGTTGGGMRFIFEPTGLGDIIKVQYGLKKDIEEIDLTETDKW